MSFSSQGLEFLDLSGVSQDERQELLLLVSGGTPAVLVLAPDTSAPAPLHPAPQAREEEQEEQGQQLEEQLQQEEPQRQQQQELDVEHEQESEQQTCYEEERCSPNTGVEEQHIPLQEHGVYGDDEGKVSVVAGTDTTISQDPTTTTTSITTSTTTTSTTATATTTTTTTAVTLPSSSSSSSSYGTPEAVGPRGFTVPPPTQGTQGQTGGQQVYQPYPPPGNPPVFNPHMPPPSLPSHYTQVPPPMLPQGATVYVANCHVNLSSSYNGSQGHTPVMASGPGPSQSPPPPSPALVSSLPIIPEPLPPPHPPQVKPVHEGKGEYEGRRGFESFRGGHRGRGRGRGRGKRLNIDRSGGEHPGFGDKHYHEAASFGGMPGQCMYPTIPYMRGGGGYPYPSGPTPQAVHGLPLVYGSPHYVQYAPAHPSMGPMVPYSSPPGSQHHPPTAIQHLHPQHPYHHPHPQQQHHFQHHQQQQQQQQLQEQQQPTEHDQTETETHEQDQFHLQQPQPQPDFSESPEIAGPSSLLSNPQFVSTPQTRPSQFENITSESVSTPAVNLTSSVAAPAEAGSVSPLTSQAASLVLDDCVEAKTTSMGIVTPTQEVPVPAVQEGEEATGQSASEKQLPAHPQAPLQLVPPTNMQVPPTGQNQVPLSGQIHGAPSAQNQSLSSSQTDIQGTTTKPNQEGAVHQTLAAASLCQAQTQVPSGQGHAPIPSGQGQAPIPSGQGQAPIPAGQGQAPIPSGQGQAPIPSGQGQAPIPSGQGQTPIPSGQGQSPPGTQVGVLPPCHTTQAPSPITQGQPNQELPSPPSSQTQPQSDLSPTTSVKPPPPTVKAPPPIHIPAPPNHTPAPPPGLSQVSPPPGLSRGTPPPGWPQVPPPGLTPGPPPGLSQGPPPSGLSQGPPPGLPQLPQQGHTHTSLSSQSKEVPLGHIQGLPTGQLETHPSGRVKPLHQPVTSPSSSAPQPQAAPKSTPSSGSKPSNTPQVLLRQINKTKVAGMEQTSLSDISFMSDEIQPDVITDIPVEFMVPPGPVGAPEPTPSLPPVVPVAEPPPSQKNTSIVASEAWGRPVNSNVGMAAPSPPAPTDTNNSLAEVVMPQLNMSSSSAAVSAAAPPGGAWAQKKSWSQLFKPCDDGGSKQVAYVAPFNQGAEKPCEEVPLPIEAVDKGSDTSLSEADLDKAKIGGMLRQYVQDHHHVALQPRGLINKANWCYINAPLQALLACPPFYNLMKSIPNIPGLKKGKSSTPVIDSIVEYIHEFNEMAPMPKPGKKDKSGNAARKEAEIVTGPPFEPSYVYKMLATINGDLFSDGRQQDAEEMLSFVLNGLHEEMMEAQKLAGDWSPSPTEDQLALNGSVNGEANISDNDDGSDDSDEWQMMGPRKRCCVTRTATFTPTPISAIFWGQLRSELRQAGGQTTANLQPFTTLPLDIQSSKVENLKDALDQLVSKEEIPDYTDAKTNQDVTVFKQVFLEELPNVLILQLKRFIYDKDGGLQKVMKKVNFPIDLEITKELMSTHCRGRFSSVQRKYKLLGVVYHDGKEATKGHYVADIYHGGYNCWLRCDDSFIKDVPESSVVRHVPPRVPYLLFYRRADTMVGPSPKPRS